MSKKATIIFVLLICIVIYKLPKKRVIQTDPRLSFVALEEINTVLEYAFKHYTNIKTINRYVEQHLGFIKRVVYSHQSFKCCNIELFCHTPLFLVNDAWVVADNNQSYQACFYDKDTLSSLISLQNNISEQSNAYNVLYPIITQLPAHIFEHYTLSLDAHWIVAYSKRYPYLRFVGACAEDFDITMHQFQEILVDQSYVKNAMNNHHYISVDMRFDNRYIVRQEV